MNIFRLNEVLLGIDPFALLYNIAELIKMIFLLEPIFLFRILKRIENHVTELHDVFVFIGLVDEAVSILSLREGLPYFCRPELISNIKAMHFTDIYLPIIKDCVYVWQNHFYTGSGY